MEPRLYLSCSVPPQRRLCFSSVCLSVLSVSWITEKLTEEFLNAFLKWRVLRLKK